MSSLRITDGLYLIHKNLPKTDVPINTDIPIDHLIVIDCSGSMSSELAKIRIQLKNKLPMMMKETDTVTIVWFSGKTQFGVVIENVALRNAVDLTGVHRAIDNYLKPIGLTGFVEPLQEVERVIGRIQGPGRAINLFFMSDGHDNQWPAPQILDMTQKLAPLVSSAAIVEFGYYCNKPLMVQMAERLGATEVLAENFPAYEPLFETAITRQAIGTKKINVELDTGALHGFAFTPQGGDVLAFAVDGRTVSVPEGVENLYWFAEMPPSADFYTPAEIFADAENLRTALYAGMVPLTQRMLSTDIFRVLKVTGDVRLIEQFANCFGKQAYADFQTEVVGCIADPNKRLVAGYDPKLVPAEDAYTILDLLDELYSDNGNLFYPNHEAFHYERIGRKAVVSDRMLTEEESERVAEIAMQLHLTRHPATIKRLQKELAGLAENKTGLNFVADNVDAGYPVSSLVTAEDRPNISALVKIPGTVDLTDVLNEAPDLPENFPNAFPTNIHRNYTIIRDGIRNVKVLPVSLTESSWRVLSKNGVVSGKYQSKRIYEINLSALPLINRKMVKAVSARDLFARQYELFMAKAKQKVYNYYADELLPSVSSAGLEDIYGSEVGSWLSGLGIKDHGYSPRVELAEATEAYMSKELKVALSGLSSLPTVKDVLSKIEAKKNLTPREAAMLNGIDDVKFFLISPTYRDADDDGKKELLSVWLTGRKRDTVSLCRNLMRNIAEIKFAIIVGQVWPVEFASLDENTLTMKFDGVEVKCTANLRETEVKI